MSRASSSNKKKDQLNKRNIKNRPLNENNKSFPSSIVFFLQNQQFRFLESIFFSPFPVVRHSDYTDNTQYINGGRKHRSALTRAKHISDMNEYAIRHRRGNEMSATSGDATIRRCYRAAFCRFFFCGWYTLTWRHCPYRHRNDCSTLIPIYLLVDRPDGLSRHSGFSSWFHNPPGLCRLAWIGHISDATQQNIRGRRIPSLPVSQLLRSLIRFIISPRERTTSKIRGFVRFTPWGYMLCIFIHYFDDVVRE